MIKALAAEYEVVEMCDLYDVSTSGYYAWLGRTPSKHDQVDEDLSNRIQEAYKASRKTYGSPRVLKDLRKKGIRCSRKRVARIMRQNGLQGVQKARYRPRTTDSRHDLPISPNRLAELPEISHVNQVWVTDITYIPTLDGWLYLTAFLDLKSRKIKGWTIRDHMRGTLIEAAFLRAVHREKPGAGLIVHSDRGCQYASREFRALLKRHQALGSMSAKGNCYDNAAMESFWATLKSDLGINKPYQTKEEARRAIFDYIEVFYNRRRIHSALGDLSPLDYEQQCVA
jgi:transposase InsO family protein